MASIAAISCEARAVSFGTEADGSGGRETATGLGDTDMELPGDTGAGGAHKLEALIRTAVAGFSNVTRLALVS